MTEAGAPEASKVAIATAAADSIAAAGMAGVGITPAATWLPQA